jgi:hypothetical protein
MKRFERRDERRIGIDPDEIPHPAFRDQLGDLVCRISVGINKESAVAWWMCPRKRLTQKLD